MGRNRVDATVRAQVLANEARTELKGSVLAWLCLSSVTAYLALHFWERAPRPGFWLWLGPMAVFLTGWVIAWCAFVARPPSDAAIRDRWVPGAKAGMTLCNLATAWSVWVFLPVSGPEQRAFMIVLFAWYLIIQFAAATEATQVLRSAVVLVLGSLCAWLLVERPPYGVTLALLLPLFGATLIAIRRFVRQAVVEATAARAAAEEARREADLALAAVARERDAKTHFIRAASHDLQQPLQAAALFLDRLKPGGRTAEQAPAIGGVRQSLTAARALVASMLEHLKLEGGVIRPRPRPLTAGELFERVLLTQGPAAAAAGMRIRTVGESLALTADPALLTRAVENLVANAIRHSEGGRVLLGARQAGGEAWLWTVDDGRGLATQDEARIFAPFEQGGHVGASGGFGLGLASTRGLVALMDGQCGVRSGLTRGSAFYIRLPLSEAAPEEVRCAA
jgi:signal transduction histidine kinase